MPLETRIALISTIDDMALPFQDLGGQDIKWITPPPQVLTAFDFFRCSCTGPTSGYEIALKFGGLICRIKVTAWGITYRKSTPSRHDIEVIQVRDSEPYQLEMIFI